MKTWSVKLCFRIAWNPALYRRLGCELRWRFIRGEKGKSDRKWGNLT